MGKKEQTFEEAMKRLEEIVLQMEQGSISLEKSLALFEEGTALLAHCGKKLDEAELKVVQLMKGPNGEPIETEFIYDDDIS